MIGYVPNVGRTRAPIESRVLALRSEWTEAPCAISARYSDTLAYGICFFRRAIDLHHMLPSTFRYYHPAAVAHLICAICCRRAAAVVALLIYTICYRRVFNLFTYTIFRRLTSTMVGLVVSAQQPHQNLLAAESQVRLTFSFGTLAHSRARPSGAPKIALGTPGCQRLAL